MHCDDSMISVDSAIFLTQGYVLAKRSSCLKKVLIHFSEMLLLLMRILYALLECLKYMLCTAS